MRKLRVRAGAAVLAAVFVFTLSGCKAFDWIGEFIQTVNLECIYFSPEYEKVEKDTLVDIRNFEAYKIAELGGYEDEYSPYCSTTFKSALSGDKLTLYNAINRAYTLGSNTLLIPSKKFSSDDVNSALYFLSCDSPFVSSNQAFSVQKIELRGVEFLIASIDYATSEKKEKRDEALEKARQIVAQMPQDLTGIQKAWHLYSYIVANVQYDKNEDYIETAQFLYDAMISGLTNCDGYSESISLLFNMAGIDTVSPYYSQTSNVAYFLKLHGIDPSEMIDEDGGMKEEYNFTDAGRLKATGFFDSRGILDDAIIFFRSSEDMLTLEWVSTGHVLNIGVIEGEAYLFDATWERSIYEYLIENNGGAPTGVSQLYFAISQTEHPQYSDIFYEELKPFLPACSNTQYEGYGIDLKFGGIDEAGIAAKIAGQLDNAKKTGQKSVLIFIGGAVTDQDYNALLDRVINQTSRVQRFYHLKLNDHTILITF